MWNVFVHIKNKAIVINGLIANVEELCKTLNEGSIIDCFKGTNFIPIISIFFPVQLLYLQQGLEVHSFESETPVCIMNTTTTGFFEMNSLTLTRLVSTLYIILAHCFGPGVARYRCLCQERGLE